MSTDVTDDPYFSYSVLPSRNYSATDFCAVSCNSWAMNRIKMNQSTYCLKSEAMNTLYLLRVNRYNNIVCMNSVSIVMVIFNETLKNKKSYTEWFLSASKQEKINSPSDKSQFWGGTYLVDTWGNSHHYVPAKHFTMFAKCFLGLDFGLVMEVHPVSICRCL